MVRILLAALAVTLLAAPPLAAEDRVSILLPPDTVTLADGPGMAVTETQCKMCHSLDYITTQPRGPAAQWHGVVAKMKTVYGAPIGDSDAKAIADYLAAHYGPPR